MTSENIEIKISGRKFQISLENFHPEAKKEIIQTFDEKGMELTDLLKLYLIKIQEHTLLNQDLKSLLEKINQ